MAAEAVRRASKSNYLTSIKNIDSNTIMAIFEKNGKNLNVLLKTMVDFVTVYPVILPLLSLDGTIFLFE